MFIGERLRTICSSRCTGRLEQICKDGRPKALMEQLSRITLAVLMSFFLSTTAFAADANCDASAKEKKLAGAALKSFMTKCEKDAQTKCDASAKTKNLHGAAEKS